MGIAFFHLPQDYRLDYLPSFRTAILVRRMFRILTTFAIATLIQLSIFFLKGITMKVPKEVLLFPSVSCLQTGRYWSWRVPISQTVYVSIQIYLLTICMILRPWYFYKVFLNFPLHPFPVPRRSSCRRPCLNPFLLSDHC